MADLQGLLNQFEIHSVPGIRQYFSEGVSPNDSFRGRPLFDSLLEMYMRSPRFSDCVRTFVEFGLEYKDQVLLAVLLDDAPSLDRFILANPAIVPKKYTIPNAAYTPMEEVSLLHICAEYNHLSCAKVLVAHKADTNAPAGLDEYGFGGQTPIFHTVNQNWNNSADMLQYLLSQSADLSHTVKGIIWGKNYEWETLIPSVNPISYAMMGLLPQMHRKEGTIAEVVSLLLQHCYGTDYSPRNVPNAYLKK